MQVSGRKSAFESKMVFFAWRQLVELKHFEAEEIGEVVGVAGIGRHVVFIDEAGIEGSDQRAAVLNVEFEAIGFAA